MINWIDAWLWPFLCGLGIWSLQWGVLIGGLLVWLAARPPRTAALRSLAAQLVLIAGLIAPCVPHFWGPIWRSHAADRSNAGAIARPISVTDNPAAHAMSDNRPAPVPTGPRAAPGLDPRFVGRIQIIEDPDTPDAPRTPPVAAGGGSIGLKRSVLLVVAALWITGTVYSLARLVVGLFGMRRLCHGAKPLAAEFQEEFELWRREAGVSRRARLGTHTSVSSPVLVGGIHPWILVPPVWTQLSVASRRTVLLHELAHLRRRDDFWRIAEELVRAPFFFHPLVRWLLTRINIEREELCDAAVIQQGVAPRELAGVLVELCRVCGIGRPAVAYPSVALPLFRQPTVKDRIQSLMEEQSMSRWTVRLGARAFAVTGTFVVLALAVVGGFGIRAEEPAEVPRKPDAVAAPDFSAELQRAQIDISNLITPDQIPNLQAGKPIEIKGFGRFTISQLAWSAIPVHPQGATGRLVDIAGNPLVPGAAVPATARVTSLAHDADEIFPQGESVLADAQGRFPFVPHGEFREGKPVSIRVRLADSQSFEAHYIPVIGKTVDVHLPTHLHPKVAPPQDVAADEIAGVVVDERGEPLEGVIVEIRDGMCCQGDGQQTVSDRQGLFRIPGFDQVLGKDECREIVIRFRKRGYSPERFLFQPLGVKGWVVALGSRTLFEGIVRGPDGQPVAGTLIRANQGPKETDRGVIGELWTETTADDEGHYRLYVQPDEYELLVRAPGVGAIRLPKQAISFGEHRTLDINLSPGIRFTARVVDSQTNVPVPNVRLWHWQYPGIEGRSDAEGQLTISDMLPGEFEFNVECAGYTRWWSEESSDEWGRRQVLKPKETWQGNFDGLRFDLQPGIKPVTIIVEQGVRIRGRIVDPDGVPVGGATAAPALTGTGNSLTGDTRFSVVSAEDGTFEMLLPASHAAEYNLVAHDGKYGEWRKWANGVTHPIRTRPGDVINDVELKLTRPAVIRGKVTDAEGRPVAGRQVTTHPADLLENRYYVPTARSAADGSFELRCVRAGTWLLGIDGRTSTGRQRVEVAAEQTVSDVVLIAPALDDELELRGLR